MCDWVLESNIVCYDPPKYGYDGVPMRCNSHKNLKKFPAKKDLYKLERIGVSKCCGKQANHGFVYGETLYCTKCRDGIKNDDIPVPEKYKDMEIFACGQRVCRGSEGKFCRTRPSSKSESGEEYCVPCGKKHNAVDTHQRCDNIDKNNIKCTERAYWGFQGMSVSKCGLHKLDGMYDKNSSICKSDGCFERSCYGYPNKKNIRCGIHKNKDMIYTSKTLCKCKENASQPIIKDNDGKLTWCTKCVPGEFKDNEKNYNYCVTCVNENLKIKVYASFNYHGEKAKYCINHATPEMVMVRRLMCVFKNCEEYPYYSKPDAKRALRCKKHMLPKDIFHTKFDLCDKCKNYAVYGAFGERASLCGEHRESGMVLNPTMKCIEKGCVEVAIHENNGYRTYCEKHVPNDPNQKSLLQKCISCGLNEIICKDNKCRNCCSYKNIHTKELIVKRLFDDEGYVYDSHDKAIDKRECSNYRPDFLFWGKHGVVIVEVDEHQHRSYSATCEINRMIELYLALSLVPTVFIRYNPDEYSGKWVAKNDRFIKLKEILDYYLENKAEYELCEVRLFYDGYNGIVEPRSMLDFLHNL